MAGERAWHLQAWLEFSLGGAPCRVRGLGSEPRIHAPLAWQSRMFGGAPLPDLCPLGTNWFGFLLGMSKGSPRRVSK